MENLEDFQKKFKIDQLKIYESDFWLWTLRPYQATVGAGILSLKRNCATFAELTQEEFADLGAIIKVIESTLKGIFDYDVISYLMLMMLDKQVHFHVIPRYEKDVEFIGYTWKDSSWPGAPNLAGEAHDMDVLLELTLNIKKNLVV